MHNDPKAPLTDEFKCEIGSRHLHIFLRGTHPHTGSQFSTPAPEPPTCYTESIARQQRSNMEPTPTSPPPEAHPAALQQCQSPNCPSPQLTPGTPIHWLPHNDLYGHEACMLELYAAWLREHPEIHPKQGDPPYLIPCMWQPLHPELSTTTHPRCTWGAVAPVEDIWGPHFFCRRHH